jgi:hypothetical protein
LQDQHLLPQSQNLSVPVISKDAQDQKVARREHNQQGMPEHEGRMTAGLAEVKRGLDSQRLGMLPF